VRRRVRLDVVDRAEDEATARPEDADALGDFALHEIDRALGPRPLERVEQDRRRDVVGYVPRHEIRLPRGLAEVHVQHVAREDRHPLVAGVPLAQPLRQLAVDLDRHDAPGSRDELFRERATAGPDLHHGVAAGDRERVGDPAQDARVRQEVLAEPFPRRGVAHERSTTSA
jgi:hypothetical protein